MIAIITKGHGQKCLLDFSGILKVIKIAEFWHVGFGAILNTIMTTMIIWKPFSRDCSNHGNHKYIRIVCIIYHLIQVLSAFISSEGIMTIIQLSKRALFHVHKGKCKLMGEIGEFKMQTQDAVSQILKTSRVFK